MATKNKKIDRAKQERVLTTAHREYGRNLHSYAFFKTHNHAASQDLVQDTFIKTWAYLVKGGEVHLMKAFLYHVLNHLIVDEYRKHKMASLDVLIEKGFEPSADNSESISNTFDAKTMLHLVKDLREKYRKIIDLRFVKELSLEETSLILGQSKNTTAVQTHRALKELKEIYNHKHGQYGSSEK